MSQVALSSLPVLSHYDARTPHASRPVSTVFAQTIARHICRSVVIIFTRTPANTFNYHPYIVMSSQHHVSRSSHATTRPSQTRRRSQSLPSSGHARPSTLSAEHGKRPRKTSGGLLPSDSISNLGSPNRALSTSSSIPRSPASVFAHGQLAHIPAPTMHQPSMRYNERTRLPSRPVPPSVPTAPSPRHASPPLRPMGHTPLAAHNGLASIPAMVPPGATMPLAQPTYASTVDGASAAYHDAAGRAYMPYQTVDAHGQRYLFAYPIQTAPSHIIPTQTSPAIPVHAPGQLYALTGTTAAGLQQTVFPTDARSSQPHPQMGGYHHPAIHPDGSLSKRYVRNDFPIRRGRSYSESGYSVRATLSGCGNR